MNKILKKKASGVLAQILENPQENVMAKTQNRMSVAVKIGYILRQKKITQKSFAKMMHKTESEISNWLSGDRNFTIDTLTDISETLGTNLLDTSIVSLYHVPSRITHDISKKRNSAVFCNNKKWSDIKPDGEDNRYELKIC